MRNLLILMLSLMAGCEESFSEVKGCRGGWVTFNCTNAGENQITENNNNNVEFCKKDKALCKTVVSTMKNNRWENRDKFSLFHDTEAKNLTVAIKDLEPGDEGTYECKSGGKRFTTVKLDIEDADDGCQDQINPTAHTGDATTITCNPKDDFKSNVRFVCKQTSRSICEEIPKSDGRFSLSENSSAFSLSISSLTLKDSGFYGCGVEKVSAGQRYRTMFRRVNLQVNVRPTKPTTPTTSTTRSLTSSPSITVPAATSPVSSTNQDYSSDNSLATMIIIVVVCVAVLLLLLLLTLVLVCKRFVPSKNTAVGNREGLHVYEEIQERPQKPDSGTALPSIYVNASFPTNPSALPLYSTVILTNGTPTHKASSAACEYSVVRSNQSPAYSTVNHPSGPCEDPLYSTVNKPQKL